MKPGVWVKTLFYLQPGWLLQKRLKTGVNWRYFRLWMLTVMRKYVEIMLCEQLSAHSNSSLFLKKLMKTPQIVRPICIGAAILASALTVKAAPYASGFTNIIVGTTTNIAYWLNTTPGAGDVVTITTYPSGASTTATPVQGSNQFTLPTGDTSYSVSINHIGSGAPAIESIASANSANTSWGGSPDPRGMDVNCYPSNGPTFGTVYMANGGAGTGHGLGLFPTHSDMSYAFGATSAGLDSSTFSGGSAGSAPYKVSVSRVDGTVLVSAIDPTVGTVYSLDPYLKTATMLLSKGNGTVHGEIYGQPRCTGSLAQGNFVLYTYDYTIAGVASNLDNFSGGAIGFGASYFTSYIEGQTAVSCIDNVCRYTIGGTSALPRTTAPDLLYNYGLNFSSGGLPADIEIGPTNGYIYSTSERTGTGSAPWLMIMDSTAKTNIWCSEDSSSDDVIADELVNFDGGADLNGCLLRISPDSRFIAMAGYYGYLAIFKLTNGIPDLSTYTLLKPVPAGDDPPRGVGFDAADNAYVLNSDTGNLYIYDLGLTETCVSSNDITGTNGSFSLTTPNLTASVTAPTPGAYQANNSYAIAHLSTSAAVPAVFTLSISAAQVTPVNLYFTLTGTATNGVQYNASTNGVNLPVTTTYMVTIPVGQTNINVTITPTATPAVGPTYSVLLNLQGGASYSAAAPTTATGFIANSGAQTLAITGTVASTMYRGLPNDIVTWNITRTGDTNIAFTLPYGSFTLGGTAAYGSDYAAGPQPGVFTNYPTAGAGVNIPIHVGDVNDSVEVGMPLPHATYTGTKTIILTGVSGVSTEGTNFSFSGSATASLLDNLPAQPEINVLWSDALTSATDQTNWTAVFSQNNTNPPLPGPCVISNYSSDVFDGTPLNFFADFGYTACLPSYDGLDLPPNGSTTVLRVTANKGGGSDEGCGVNLYPENCPILRGNYSVRFNMNLVRGCNSSGGSEYCVFGINHYGTNANWIWDGAVLQSNSPTDVFSFTNSDGIWFSVASDPLQFGSVGGYPSDYVLCTATNSTGANKFFPSTGYWPLNGASSTSFTNVFKQIVDYTSYNYDISNNWGYPLVGVPANQSGWYGAYDGGSVSSCAALGALPTNSSWTDVEIRQSNNVVTLLMNATTIFTYTNATPFTNGYPMLGYYDPYVGEGTGGGVYYSDIRAIELSPDLVTAPASVTVGAGTNHTFTVSAIGSGPYTNTWYSSPGNVVLQQDVVSTANDSDSFTVVSPTATASYYVVVSDASGPISSPVVTLTVDFPPAITTPPASLSVYSGATAKFTVTATGTATLAYQWTSNTVNMVTNALIAGTTTSALTLTGVTVHDSASYGVVVTNAYGKITNTAVLTVLPPNPSLISSFSAVANGIKIGFYTTSGDTNDTTNSFFVQSSTNLSSPVDYGFTNLTSPTITVTGGTNFSVTIPTNSVDQTRYYRILHKPY